MWVRCQRWRRHNWNSLFWGGSENLQTNKRSFNVPVPSPTVTTHSRQGQAAVTTLLRGWSHWRQGICLWMWIFGQNPWTDADAIFEHSHLSGVHLRCDALHCCPVMDGYQRCADPRIFSPHPVQPLASAIMSPSPRILNLHLPKLSDMRSIRVRVRVSAPLWWLHHNPVTEPLWSDYDSDTLFTVSDFTTAYQEGRSDRWQDTI